MNKLSVIIVTYNEEKRISKCLKSVKWADEIVVVDQSSTDGTVEICKEFTDKVFVIEYKGFCEPDRGYAASKAQNEWLLYLDADEVVPEELGREITDILSQGPRCDSYYIPRKNIFLGKWIKYSGWRPGYCLRLFKKESVKFPEMIHDDILPLGDHGYLKESIIHVTCDNLEEYLEKVNRYTTVLAREMYEQGERPTPGSFMLKILALPPARFVEKFFLKGGFMDCVQW